MNSFQKGRDVVKQINNPNLKLLLHIYHLQHISGSIIENIKKLLLYTGHIQIAQVPNRHEPDTLGEIDCNILSILDEEKYDGHIGLEYRPESSSRVGLNWIQKYGYKL